MAPKAPCNGEWDEEIQTCLLRYEKLKAVAIKLEGQKRTSIERELEQLRKKRVALWEKYKQSRQSNTAGKDTKKPLLEMQEALDKSFSRFNE
ncbi:MAG: hypothetical protein RBT11_14920 [Desulfobacterales bacterium]|jgi:hypothetical protein|nr:hypothetical protein [Desulfobacterales bacterium]